jgi:Cytochrome P460
MIRPLMGALLALLLPLGGAAAPPPAPADVPTYTTTGAMNLPENYREWVFLSSGLDISYTAPTPAAEGHSVFQNVFVNPSAYRAYQATGTWPDKTMLVLEIRGAGPKAGIDKRGQTQTTELRAVEIHVKDEAKIPGKWGFFEFGSDGKVAKLTEPTATCYSCHQAHAAVDTTFVQFYPTLIGTAKAKATLSPEYLKELAVPPAPAK